MLPDAGFSELCNFKCCKRIPQNIKIAKLISIQCTYLIVFYLFLEFCEIHCGAKTRIHQQSVTFEPVYNICKNDFKKEDKHENIIENGEHQHNITSKLLRIFKSKKWRQKTTTRNDEIVFDKPLSFPKVKLRKTSQVQDVIETEVNQVNHHPAATAKQQEFVKTPLKISKSLPLRKPVIVWEEIQEFQKLIPPNCDEKISVGTQTELSCLKQVTGLEHRKLQRVSITQITQNQNHRITQPGQPVLNTKQVSLEMTKSSDDDECNMEVYKTFCHVPANGDGAADSSLHSTSSSSRSRELDGISSVIRYRISLELQFRLVNCQDKVIELMQEVYL